jgi:nitrite reductase (NO-forming)
MINQRFFALLTLAAFVLGMAGCSAPVAQISPHCQPGGFAGDCAEGTGQPVVKAAATNQPAVRQALAQQPTAIPPGATTAPSQGDQSASGTIEIHSFEMSFKPAKLDVAKPGRYTIKLVNDGAILHDITFPGGVKLAANAGATASGEIEIPAGGVSFICSVPGHEQAGMTGALSVAGSTPAQAASHSTDDHGGAQPDTDVQADPNAPKYQLYDAPAPARLDGQVHEIELVTEEKPMTVADGFVQHVWTFNGKVPGPLIRVKVGDTVRITLKNPATSMAPHSVDFHSSMVASNDEMTSINPGEEKLYEWKALYAGVWMYHCGTAPTLHHIANGMYGMVIVEPKDGLPNVDHEFALVQSEWYLGPQGDLTSLKKLAAAAPAPDFVVFNGVANQYKDNPIKVETGKRVRMFVLNAGPSVDSAFHIVGTIFDTVIKEGVQLTRDNPGGYGSQVVDLAPAQGAIIEFTTAEDGMYPIVTHAFNFVGRGALGLVQAGDGDPKK